MSEQPFALVLPFDRDSADFARGVEVGMLWARLAQEPRPVTALVHADNAEMVMRMADAAGLRASGEDRGPDWLGVTLSERSLR